MMSCASLIVATAALVGFALADDKSLSTLPLAAQFIATMFTSIPAAMMMQRLGRKTTFMLATLFGVGGGFLGCLAILNHRFWLFVLATTQIGIFQGFSNYIRYTAAESVEISDKSKAISFVMLGGVLAAVIGPNLAKYSREWIEGAEFAGSYGAVIILYVLILFVLSFLNLDEKGQSLQKDAQGKLSPDTGRPLLQIAMQPNYIIAMVSGMIGYGVMSFVMTATPLAMSQHAFIFNDTSFVIQWHVLAMFAPSFFTGSLIVRFGVIKVMICGAILGLACVLINLHGASLMHFVTALICLGISWNFLFVGATTMITDTYEAKEKNKAQALNDFAVFTTVAVASLSAGALQNLYGWKIVNIGVLPLLAIVVVALLWLSRKHRYLSLAQIEVLEESTLSGSN
tara:strand:+ start:18466 stop:19662 length:1197 start_codon:yes stop_codon:yes gene_type:complete